MELHKKFILSTTFLLIIVLAIYSWYDIRINREQIEANHRDKVEFLTEIIRNGLLTLMCEGKGEEFQKFIESLIAEDIAAVRIFSDNGTILNSSIPGEVGSTVSPKDMDTYLSRDAVTNFSKKLDGRQVYSKIVFINNSWLCQKCHGSNETIRGILDVEISTSEKDQKISDAARHIIKFSVIMLILLSSFVWLLSVRLVKKPLTEIIGAVKKSKGDFIRESLSGRKDEIGILASNYNNIISDLIKSKAEADKCRSDKIHYTEKMASIGELAAAVAHEIKNPLAGISGALQVLAEDFPDNSPRKEIAAEILNEIERLDRAVKDLITYSRTPSLNLILTDINAIIEKLRNGLKTTASQFNVDIRLITEKIPEIMVDHEQMENALFNIAIHCLQSMQKGGILTIKSQYRQDKDEVEITLSSTGEGIPRENINEVFKPLFSTKHTGTGLGMAISKNIVESHRGRIEVESQQGAGATFRIILTKG